MPKCIVSGCPNHTARKDKNISNGIMLHGFPKDLLRIKCWLSQIGQNFGDLESFARRILEGKKTNSFRICSEHFSPDSYRQTKRKTVLKDNAIPRHFHKNPPLSKAQSVSGNTIYISSSQPMKGEASAPTCAVRKDVSACSDSTTDIRNTAKAFVGVQHRDVRGSPRAQPFSSEPSPLLKMTTMDNSNLHKTDRILSLTLQILFLLTGEDYTVVKKTSADHITSSSSPTDSGGRSVARETDPMPTTDFVSHEKNKEILQLTNQIIRLLTGEVPARCQDIAVYFSVEEWDYVDKHKNLYKNIIVDDQQSLYKNIIMDDQQSLYKNIILDDRQSLYKNIIIDDQQGLYKNIFLDNQQNPYKNIILDGQRSLYKNIVMNNHQLLPKGEQPVLTPKPEKRDDFIVEPLNGFNITAVKSLTGGDYISFDLTKEEPVSVDSMDGEDRISTAQELWFSECGDEPVSTPEHEIEIVIEDDFIEEPLNDFYTTTINSPTDGDDVSSDLGEPVAADGMNRDDGAAQKPLSCSECGKCFRYPSRLIEHERVHTGEKPFSCPECGKCFIWKSLLVQHTKIHTGEHQCLFCRKCFTNKAKLIDHQRTHTGERPFTCNLCRKSFGLKTSLTKHQRLHMREKLLCCSECGKCFMQESNLYRHQRTHMCQQPL